MDLEPILRPRSMAIVGVSRGNDRHPANVIFNKNHLRLPIRVYPVNPKGGRLQGCTVYPSVLEVPEKVDLAVIAVRAEHCPDILAECIQAGARGAVVVSGGFAETGNEDLQERLTAIAREAEFPFVGPNCLGIYAPGWVDTFFLPQERLVRPSRGNVAVVSQSGGILVDQMVKFAGEGVGLSLALSIGNKAGIRELDVLGHLTRDPDTKVIAFYIEGFGRNEGREFVLEADRSPKPIIVFKAGKSDSGSLAVSSHTASLGGDYHVFSEVLAQFGIVEARNELEMVSFCESLSCYQRSIEGRIGVITGSGGHGVLAADFCNQHGLSTPRLSKELQGTIKETLSPRIQEIASLANPIDLTGSAVDEDFIQAADALSRSREVDCVLVLLLPYIPGITLDLGARLSQIQQRDTMPLIAYVPHIEKYRMLIEGFELNRIPASPSIEGAVLMADAMRRCAPC